MVFEQRLFIYAEFSYNKFKGLLFGLKDQRFFQSVGMHFLATANRLSGHLPHSFESAYNLSQGKSFLVSNCVQQLCLWFQ